MRPHLAPEDVQHLIQLNNAVTAAARKLWGGKELNPKKCELQRKKNLN